MNELWTGKNLFSTYIWYTLDVLFWLAVYILNPFSQELLSAISEKDKQLRFKDDVRRTKFESIERDVFDFLKDFLKFNEYATILIHGNELPQLHTEGKKKQEMDFLIINYHRQYILNIEVKHSLNKKAHKAGTTTEKVIDQLNNNKSILKSAFRSDLKGEWDIYSIAFAEKIADDVKICKKCSRFVTERVRDVNIDEEDKHDPHASMKDLENKLLDLANKPDQFSASKYADDFKLLCKYLLFCLPMIQLPVRGTFHRFVDKAIQKAGSIENIMIWCFPTAHQRSLLGSPRVVFLAPWGSGKTLMMVHESIKLADSGEKVLFIVFNNGNLTTKKTLITLDIEEKCAHDNITVIQANYPMFNEMDLDILADGHDHLFADELFGDYIGWKEENLSLITEGALKYKTVWIALSNSTFESSNPSMNPESMDDIDDCLLPVFDNYTIVEMNQSLRMPKKVFGSLLETSTKKDFNEFILSKCIIPADLVEGCDFIERGFDNNKSLSRLLYEEFQDYMTDNCALVVLDDSHDFTFQRV